jgi:DNA processing protein
MPPNAVKEQRREQAAVLALAVHARGPWHLLAQVLEHVGSALALVELAASAGSSVSDENGRSVPVEELLEPVDAGAVTADELARFASLIESTRAEGHELVTVLDERYPTNLRLVHDRPPFLFVGGTHDPRDSRAVAVVGTRQASQQGLALARSLAAELAVRNVTVVSGLAKGIDGAAHQATLEAGGRTVAVVGTGIRRVYPAEHRELAARIVEQGGAILSQFLPDAPPRQEHFPLRNRTMSGYSIGTVVVEASSTSGAKMQARLALAHNKRLFLVRGLVTSEPWAQRYAEHPATTIVDTVDDVLEVLDAELAPPAQLTLT